MELRPFKVLIASLGTRGDVQPYTCLAGALSRLGANVSIATGEGFDTMIEAAGAKACPVSIDYQKLLQDAEIRAALFSVRGMIKAASDSIALQQRVALELWQIALDEKPDLILFNLKAVAVVPAARRLSVPALPVSLQPVTEPTGSFALPLFGLPSLGRWFNRTSFSLGRRLMAAGLKPVLKPVRRTAPETFEDPFPLMDGHAPDGGHPPSLQAFSKALVPTPADWPRHVWQDGYWFADPDPDYTPPEALEAFLASGPSPIYLGFGSMPSKDPGYLTETVFKALSRLETRAILSIGWGGLSAQTVPDNLRSKIHILEKAPHGWLFPRCTAVVHHGGAGTTHEALRWGKPSLVCPLFGDQPFWGRQVQRIGAGPEMIPQKKMTADRLTHALEELTHRKHQAGAQKAAEIMARESGAAGTANRLLITYAPKQDEQASTLHNR